MTNCLAVWSDPQIVKRTRWYAQGRSFRTNTLVLVDGKQNPNGSPPNERIWRYVIKRAEPERRHPKISERIGVYCMEINTVEVAQNFDHTKVETPLKEIVVKNVDQADQLQLALLSTNVTEHCIVRIALTDEGKDIENTSNLELGKDFQLYYLRPVYTWFRTIRSLTDNPFVLDYDAENAIIGNGPVVGVDMHFKLYSRDDLPKTYEDGVLTDQSGWTLVKDTRALGQPENINIYEGDAMPGLVKAVHDLFHSEGMRGRILLGPHFAAGPYLEFNIKSGDTPQTKHLKQLLNCIEWDTIKLDPAYEALHGKTILLEDVLVTKVYSRNAVLESRTPEEQFGEVNWWKDLGSRQLKKGRFECALAIYERTSSMLENVDLALSSDSVRLQYNRCKRALWQNSCLAYMRQQKWYHAYQFILALASPETRDFTDPKFFYRKAVICRNIDRLDEAYVAIKEAEILNPADPLIKQEICTIKRLMNNIKVSPQAFKGIERTEADEMKAEEDLLARKFNVAKNYLEFADLAPRQERQIEEYNRVWRSGR